MKTLKKILTSTFGLGLLVVLATVFTPVSVSAEGTWIPLQGSAPNGIGTMLLLSDGTVMAQYSGNPSGQNQTWYKLTPGSTGGYTNGMWTNLPSMHYARLFYSSDVLTNGNVFIAGAEYGNGTTNAEMFNPVTSFWSDIPVPSGIIKEDNTINTNDNANRAGFLDSDSVVLSNGKVLVTPVYNATNGNTTIYDPVTGAWSLAKLQHGRSEDEASTVKLPDDSILVTDSGAQTSERFIPSLNEWIPDANIPVPLFDVYGGEEGAGFLLPNGNAFYLGSTPNTAIYTPSGGTSAGSWIAGPEIPAEMGAPNSPAAMMVNGKILCAMTPTPYQNGTNVHVFNKPTYFYEYDYSSGSIGAFTQIHAQNGSYTNPILANFHRMLDLPDGTVLFTDSTASLYVYKPDGTPLAACQPAIYSVSWNLDGSLHLSGTLFNGIAQGAAFGDDVQMDSNYPLVRFTDGNGKVTYGRTYNWSSTSVQTGSAVVTTECKVPPNIYDNPGSYYLQVVANGNASGSMLFYSPVWVNFNYTGSSQNGSFGAPYKTLSAGLNAVASGGTIAIYGATQPSTSAETLTLSKPVQIIAVSGPSTVGN